MRLPIKLSSHFTLVLALPLILSSFSIPASAADAPGWMHNAANAPLPAHDEKTDAVLLFSEHILTVQSNGKIKALDRSVYKILRVGGKHYGLVRVHFDADTKISALRGWCIPAQGKDFEVKEKDAMETSIAGIGELVSSVRVKALQIPAADPGNIVGYEIEQDLRPYILEDDWFLQELVPTAEARFTLQLPSGWEYKAAWFNHAPIEPTPIGNNGWQWIVKDVPAVKGEYEMPPWRGLAEQMLVSLLPAGGSSANRGFQNWDDMGTWQRKLAAGRRDVSPEMKQKVAELTASAPNLLQKMRLLADFAQREIRYVAIELGIGGFQPHPAHEVFSHRYGDCKDKATLVSAMFSELGVESYYIIINSERGAVGPDMPAHMNIFNHAILAVRLPDSVVDTSVVAVLSHPKLGRLLIFDPTDEMTPFGQLRGALQANYGLLVTPTGGELVELPQLPASFNTTQRFAKFKLDPAGTLTGDIREIRQGDPAKHQRRILQASTKDSDRIKFIESFLSHSLGTFQITKATIGNLAQNSLPFEYNYSLVAPNYAKTAGDLLLVRPRVVGNEYRDLLETKEPRKYPVEFAGPWRNVDNFEITLPAGYEIDDLPPSVDADYSFASYHSKAEVKGQTLKYTRTFEIKELSVPVSKVAELKALYRTIAGDERNTAVLKPSNTSATTAPPTPYSD
jgi:hypothetical protein